MKSCTNPLCPLAQALSVIGGKWKPHILHQLHKSPKRFGQLDALIPGLSRKVLTTQLRELCDDKLIVRESFAEAPPRVEYQLTEKGRELMPIFGAIADWGIYLVEEHKREKAATA